VSAGLICFILTIISGLRYNWTEALAKGTRYECECRLRSHDGAYRDFRVRVVPVREPDGSIREWIGQCWGCDGTQAGAGATRQSEARFRAAVEGSGDAFLLLEGVRDSAGTILDFVCVDANHCWTK